ncbi:Zinc finger, A20-type [Dillenia turbinata]|uniref:Zinc finger, A20-type n=1 Tax=Dillenia turbinata TaxID=194707 RepID=A0AAN8VL73_9MAGN
MEHSSVPMSLEVDVSDTIGRLKERIQSIPMNRLVLRFLGNESNNRSFIHECSLHHQSHIEVSIRASPPAAASTPSGGNAGSKNLKLFVLPKCGTKKIPVEVNASDNVGELRKQLPILQEKLHFNLPSDGRIDSMDHNETGCQPPPEGPILCINNCGFFGSAATMNMCSKCHKDMVLKQEQEKLAASSIENLVNESSSGTEKEPIVAGSADVHVDLVVPKVAAAQPSQAFSFGQSVLAEQFADEPRTRGVDGDGTRSVKLSRFGV